VTLVRRVCSALGGACRMLSRGWARTVRAVGSGVYRWRASLQVRVITSTLVVGIAALAALGGYLSDRIRDGMYGQRVEQLLAESKQNTLQAQATLDASPATTQDEIEQLFIQLVSTLQVGGSGERDVFLLRYPGD